MLTLHKKDIDQAINDKRESEFTDLVLGDHRGTLTLKGDTKHGKPIWRNMFADHTVLRLKGRSYLRIKPASRFTGHNTLINVTGATDVSYHVYLDSSKLENVKLVVNPGQQNNYSPLINLTHSESINNTLLMGENEQVDLTYATVTEVTVHDSDLSYCKIEAKNQPSVISNSTLAGAIIEVTELSLQNAELLGIHYKGKRLVSNPLVIKGGPGLEFVGQLLDNEYMVYDGQREVNLGVWEQHYVDGQTNFVLAGIAEIYLKAFKAHRDVSRLVTRIM